MQETKRNYRPIVIWLDDLKEWAGLSRLVQENLTDSCSIIFCKNDVEAVEWILHYGESIAVFLQDINRITTPDLVSRLGAWRNSKRGQFPIPMQGGDLYFNFIDIFAPEVTTVFHSGQIHGDLELLLRAWSGRDQRIKILRKPSRFDEIEAAILHGVETWKNRKGMSEISDEARLLAPVSEELAAICGSNTAYIEAMTPRQFEEMLGSVLKNQGFRVELTAKSRDGGYDLSIVENSSLPNDVTLVEAKKYDPGRAVPVSVVRSLYGVKALIAAKKVMLVTSSRISQYAKNEFSRVIPTEIEIVERERLEAWCRSYLNGVLDEK